MNRRGFTLIEMIAVVLLLGLLAGSVAYAMTGELRRGTREEAVDVIRYMDHMTRLTADRFGRPCALRFELDKRRLRRVIDPAGRSAETLSTRRLPRPFRIDRLVAATVDDQRRGKPTLTKVRGWEHGRADVNVGVDGRGPTYALRLTGDARDEWLVFAGLTGRMMRVEDERAVDNLFDRLSGGRLDAD